MTTIRKAVGAGSSPKPDIYSEDGSNSRVFYILEDKCRRRRLRMIHCRLLSIDSCNRIERERAGRGQQRIIVECFFFGWAGPLVDSRALGQTVNIYCALCCRVLLLYVLTVLRSSSLMYEMGGWGQQPLDRRHIPARNCMAFLLFTVD